jgi:hypothetical protein
MPLEQIQYFLTKYLRDPDFRQRYRNSELVAIERELNLTKADLDIVRSFNLDDLDRTAIGLRDERRSKRETEFQQFVDHLAIYGPMDTFFEQYDSRYTEGLLTRPQEMSWFLNFATNFVLAHKLPNYLIDLLRFCYHYVKLSDTPRERTAPLLQELPVDGLQPSHTMQLRKPYKIVQFRYDVLYIARQSPSLELAALPPQPTELFIQKNWNRAKETQILYTSELPFLPLLQNGPVIVLDLLATLSSDAYGQAVVHLEELFRRGVIEVSSP